MPESNYKTKEDLEEHQKNTQRYTLLKVVGKGQYGEVFKAKCNITNQEVAIKYIEFKNVSECFMRAICRELKVLSLLSKMENNVFTVKLLDVFFADNANLEDLKTIDRLYIVTDFY